MEAQGRVSISMDIMEVNGIPFLVIISTVLQYAACFDLSDMKTETKAKAIEKMVRIYRAIGFKIVVIASDNGFAALRKK